MTEISMRTPETIKAELKEAERALACSYSATRSHGHQRLSWLALQADSLRVKTLRDELAARGEPS